jgi:inhibitor of KinA sporulation pathway (predicted exonuclease)
VECSFPDDGTPREIIQWPAVLLDMDTRQNTDSFNEYVTPRNRVTRDCTEMTGITQHMVTDSTDTRGGDVRMVLARFEEWVEPKAPHGVI